MAKKSVRKKRTRESDPAAGRIRTLRACMAEIDGVRNRVESSLQTFRRDWPTRLRAETVLVRAAAETMQRTDSNDLPAVAVYASLAKQTADALDASRGASEMAWLLQRLGLGGEQAKQELSEWRPPVENKPVSLDSRAVAALTELGKRDGYAKMPTHRQVAEQLSVRPDALTGRTRKGEHRCPTYMNARNAWRRDRPTESERQRDQRHGEGAT